MTFRLQWDTLLKRKWLLKEGRRLKLSEFSRYITFLICNSWYPTQFFVFWPAGSSKYGTTHKNSQRYYTPKRVIRYISPRDLCNDRSAQRRTGISYFINPLIFSLNKPKTCNREKKKQNWTYELKGSFNLTRITSMRKIGHFVKFVFTDLPSFVCGEINF